MNIVENFKTETAEHQTKGPGGSAQVAGLGSTLIPARVLVFPWATALTEVQFTEIKNTLGGTRWD